MSITNIQSILSQVKVQLEHHSNLFQSFQHNYQCKITKSLYLARHNKIHQRNVTQSLATQAGVTIFVLNRVRWRLHKWSWFDNSSAKGSSIAIDKYSRWPLRQTGGVNEESGSLQLDASCKLVAEQRNLKLISGQYDVDHHAYHYFNF